MSLRCKNQTAFQLRYQEAYLRSSSFLSIEIGPASESSQCLALSRLTGQAKSVARNRRQSTEPRRDRSQRFSTSRFPRVGPPKPGRHAIPPLRDVPRLFCWEKKLRWVGPLTQLPVVRRTWRSSCSTRRMTISASFCFTMRGNFSPHSISSTLRSSSMRSSRPSESSSPGFSRR